MSSHHFLVVLVSLAGPLEWARAFNGHIVTAGPITLAVSQIATVTHYDTSQPVRVALTNVSARPVSVWLELTNWIDECRAAGPSGRRLEVPAQGSADAEFQFAVGRGAYSALYPIHVIARFQLAGIETNAHAIQIFQTDFSAVEQREAARPSLPVNVVPSSGALALASLKTHRIAWQWFSQLIERLPVGWEGNEEKSSAHFSRGPITRGGVTKYSLQMHPPWKGGAGTLFVEYRLKLPGTVPIRLSFANAIRDNGPKEPPSDGVTFRVWVGDEPVFARHTDSKTWLLGEANLGKFAGQAILLRLECHPGPKNDTTCDLGFWGDPTLVVGAAPRVLTAKERQTRAALAASLTGRSKPTPTNVFRFELAEGGRAVVALGPNGFADAALAFRVENRTVAFAGMKIDLLNQTLGVWPSGAVVEKFEANRDVSGRVKISHRARVNDAPQDLAVELWPEGAGLRVKITGSARITDLALDRANQKAKRVYYGHGYCIVEPGAFRAGGGGHNLATSHVGFDFEDGLSLLTACDTPPDNFQVDPAQRLYALHTHPDSTFTFVPSAEGAFDCALKYRPLDGRKAAAGVARKAGRFVFDIWGGRYADDAAKLQRCFDYGVTHSLAIMHVWQRWGYDYRLPDVFPPLPSLGTLEDLRALGRACDRAGALWGLHDNYIDIYPDCDGFSYDHVTFTADGRPRQAWLNEGRRAQSYQFRPDHVRPFLERNLNLIAPALRPSASFVDVWTSINAFDYFDRQGTFHSKMETLRCWGDGFALIRDTLGGHAPTTSEAGSDQLIGRLDGADCQFLMLSAKGGRFQNVVPCRAWSRVPWFDAVHHARFSLHGVGYSDRYQGGRARDLHGIESDDYLSAEMLTGHALMMDLPNLVRGSVRKYWLAQEFIESVAFDEIRQVEFAGGDVRRLIIDWDSGARVYVNRGKPDWTVAGRTLPQDGFFAKHGPIEASVERIAGRIVEQSRGTRGFYVNGRGFNTDAPLAIQPGADRLEYLGGRNFRLAVNWEADQPAPKDYTVFYHFTRPTPGRYTETEFYGGGEPATPTTQWSGRMTTDWQVTIPEGTPLGEYEVLVGLYDRRNRSGERIRLLGAEDGNRRYRIGKLEVEGTRSGNATNVTAVRLVKPAQPPVVERRTLPNPAATDFGPARTKDAFRAVVNGRSLLVTPLPDGEDFPLTLRPEAIFGHEVRVKQVEAVDAQGTALRPVSFTREQASIAFMVRSADFGYRLTVE
jgi:hypothetical protein